MKKVIIEALIDRNGSDENIAEVVQSLLEEEAIRDAFTNTGIPVKELTVTSVQEAPKPRVLTCDMEEGCTACVTHIDEKGYVYCTPHGEQRKATSSKRCRKLRPAELKDLQAGKTIRYEVRR